MTPKAYMIFGAATSIAFTVLGCFVAPSPFGSIGVICFAGGCLFGKGYGILEERGRAKSHDD